jgi:hypothetical protein
VDRHALANALGLQNPSQLADAHREWVDAVLRNAGQQREQ